MSALLSLACAPFFPWLVCALLPMACAPSFPWLVPAADGCNIASLPCWHQLLLQLACCRTNFFSCDCFGFGSSRHILAPAGVRERLVYVARICISLSTYNIYFHVPPRAPPAFATICHVAAFTTLSLACGAIARRYVVSGPDCVWLTQSVQTHQHGHVWCAPGNRHGKDGRTGSTRRSTVRLPPPPPPSPLL